MAEAEHSPAPQFSRGVYGFVLFITMCVVIIFYFVWMLAPANWYKDWIYEPPQTYWGLAVPVYFCTTLFLFAFCIYPALHCSHDCELNDLSATTDRFSVPPNYFNDLKKSKAKVENAPQHSKFKPPESRRRKGRTWSGLGKYKVNLDAPREDLILENEKPILPVSDLDLDEVCRLLYLKDYSD